MSVYISPQQQKRIDDVNSVLKYFNELDIPDDIIKKINRKFKSTKYYKFIRTEEIEMGMMIRCVDLNMTKITMIGIVVNIIKTSSGGISAIRLYNSSGAIYWKINPDKYHIFHVEKGTDNMNMFIRQYFESKQKI